MHNAPASLLFSAAVLLFTSGQAATVTSTADDGPGSLRAAIALAAPGETIDFAVNGIITLTSGELMIDKNLTIVGPGSDSLILQRGTAAGTPAFRIVNVAGGIVHISGLTLRNGRAPFGGGLHNQGTLTLSDCVITDNIASERGGGLNNGSTVTLSGCRVLNNLVAGDGQGFGGGMHNNGTLAAINSEIRGNAILAIESSHGGGIFNDGTLALTNSVVIGNSLAAGPEAEGSGGGLFNSGTLTLHTSTVSSNSATGGSQLRGGGGVGGGIASILGTTTLHRSTVSDNLARGGDGIAGVGGLAHGGGIANDLGTVVVVNSTISGNGVVAGTGTSGAGSADGGGCYNRIGSVSLNHSTVTANVVPGNPLAGSGGLFNANGVVEVRNVILAGNIGVNLYNNQLGNIVSGGFNLIGSTVGTIPPGPSDRFDVTAGELRLGPLQDNGGPTFTHALLCGSPAIDAGDNAGAPPTDQRGFPRIVGGIIDIGAFEDGNRVPVLTCPGPINLNCVSIAGQTATLAVDVADADGDPLVVTWMVNGTLYQTNAVAAGDPPTVARVEFTALFIPGEYVVSVSATDASECVVACSIWVSVTAGPTVTATNNGPLCTGGTLNLSASSPTAVSYLWSGPNNFSSTAQNPSIPGVTPAASGTYLVTATDTNGCTATAMTTVTVNGGGDLYPIALHVRSLDGVSVGDVIFDIYNGVQPGNFGWLSWAGSPNEPTLVTSLTPPGNSHTYINPRDRRDRVVSVGDWVRGKPGVTNSRQVRAALDTLKHTDIVVPVWDQAVSKGRNSEYRVIAFARVRITDYQLPKQNRISARFLGFAGCD